MRKHWIVISSIAGACFMLILNAPTLITNLENLPADVSRITTKFVKWYYDDEGWTGFWSESPEGYIDIGNTDLSDAQLGIDIISTSGEIEGIIGTREICHNLPLLDFCFSKEKQRGMKLLSRPMTL